MAKDKAPRNIDFVITWVDGSDPDWLKERRYWQEKAYPAGQSREIRKWFDHPLRYRDWETLRYLFRGIEKFAPWVRTVHFVTWGHVPSWLDTSNPRLHVTSHREYIPENLLPTFNSHTIEWHFHKIPGISEQFVYFNDDMFLLMPCEPEDFFKDGLPRETAAVDCIPLIRDMGHAEIQNMQILNSHFNKKEVLRRHWKKWYAPMYGKVMLRTMFLTPWPLFTGLYTAHTPVSYLKRIYEEVWEKEEEAILSSCTKFREPLNASPWLVQNWQMVTGNFIPRPPKFSRAFFEGINEQVCEQIRHPRYHMVCLNDMCTDEEDFLRQKELLLGALENLLPERSRFEKE